MARIKGAVTTRKRRKKILKLAKGFYGAKSKQFRTANQAVNGDTNAQNPAASTACIED